MPEYSCYTMDLYCERDKGLGSGDVEHPFRYFDKFQYTGETHGACVKQARDDGWIFKQDRSVICPMCSGKKPVRRDVVAADEVISIQEFSKRTRLKKDNR